MVTGSVVLLSAFVMTFAMGFALPKDHGEFLNLPDSHSGEWINHRWFWGIFCHLRRYLTKAAMANTAKASITHIQSPPKPIL